MKDEIAPESEEEYQARKERLKADAKETKEKLDAEQSEMMAAVAAGDDGIDVEKYETVKIGEVDVKVKAWLPGESLETIERAQRLAGRDNLNDALDSIHTMLDGMTTVTESLEHNDIRLEASEEIRKFWKGMYNKWGIEGFQQAAETVLEPASEDLKRKSDAADGFRKNTERTKPSDYR